MFNIPLDEADRQNEPEEIRSLSKKQISDRMKHKKAFTWFAVALVLVLLMIPWGLGAWNPGRPLWRGI